MDKGLFMNLSDMNSAEYKRYHESFMENNYGSTAFHTFACILFTVFCSLYCSMGETKSYFYEYIFIVLPLILAHTLLAEYIYVLLVIVGTMLCLKCFRFRSKLKLKTLNQPNYFSTRIQSVSSMRSLTYLITVFCILAVDFRDFPRYLAKTEKYGYSLMDTGVGLFVLMSGLVHKNIHKDNYNYVLKSNIKFICILVLLGIGRFLSVKQLDYQEHISEYGVHWNFFFTLAVCKLSSSVVLLLSNRALTLSLLSLIIHEYLLFNRLEEWVFCDDPRIDLISANREGLSSCLGYTSLYLFAVHVKNFINDISVCRFVILGKLFAEAVILWVLTYVIHMFRPTSRSLANAGYCVYLEAVLMTVISILYVFEVLFQNKEEALTFRLPHTLAAVNNNGLVYFLVANIMTGVINMRFRTLLLNSISTFIILNMYMTAALGLTVYLNKKGIKI